MTDDRTPADGTLDLAAYRDLAASLARMATCDAPLASETITRLCDVIERLCTALEAARAERDYLRGVVAAALPIARELETAAAAMEAERDTLPAALANIAGLADADEPLSVQAGQVARQVLGGEEVP